MIKLEVTTLDEQICLDNGTHTKINYIVHISDHRDLGCGELWGSLGFETLCEPYGQEQVSCNKTHISMSPATDVITHEPSEKCTVSGLLNLDCQDVHIPATSELTQQSPKAIVKGMVVTNNPLMSDALISYNSAFWLSGDGQECDGKGWQDDVRVDMCDNVACCIFGQKRDFQGECVVASSIMECDNLGGNFEDAACSDDPCHVIV